MKLIFKDNKIIVFLNKPVKLKEIKSEDYFKKLFINIKNKYNLKLNGYYKIYVFVDKFYGSIIEIENEELDYYDYFNQIDMEIKVINSTFLYQINYDYLTKDILEKVNIYKIKDKLYIKILEQDILNKIIEYSKIIYDESAKEILKASKKVKI